MKKGIYPLLLIIMLPSIPIVLAFKADLIKTDYLSLLVEFEYFTESSISKFNNFITIIVSFIITIHNQDYQLKKENDYASLPVEFIYDMHDPTALTLTTHTSSTNIASDMNIQKQESITNNRYTTMNIQLSIDLDVKEKESGDYNT